MGVHIICLFSKYFVVIFFPPKYAKFKENWKIALSDVCRLFRVTKVSPDVPVESSYALPSLGDDFINT